MANAQVLIKQLKQLVENPEELQGDEVQKQELLKLTRQAAIALESPFETLQRLVYSPLPLVAARISQDRGILSTLAEEDGKDGVALETLTAASGLKAGVLESLLDYLCAQGMAHQVSQGRYASTRLTQLLLVPVFVDGIIHFHDNCLPGFAALHRALTDGEGTANAFKLGHNSSEDFYTWLETHPVQQGAFHRFMDAQFSSLPTWLDAVPFATELASDTKPGDVVFVDVGGGNGSQLAALKAACPGISGRMILQDRPHVLTRALQVDGMELMAYDFLTEQPVRGARVYYFRQILHNFDDETCVRILRSQIPALTLESVIVVDEKVLPDEKLPAGTPGSEYTAALSIAMKVMFDAQERRETHWRRILDEAGLVVRDIRKYTKFDDAAIIAVGKPS